MIIIILNNNNNNKNKKSGFVFQQRFFLEKKKPKNAQAAESECQNGYLKNKKINNTFLKHLTMLRPI